MTQLRFTYLVFGLITFLAVGVITPNAGAGDGPRGRVFTDSDVRGAYAFSFQGTIIEVGPIAATGVLVADGKGNITKGIRTLNVNGFPAQQTFTCSYSVNPDGTGSAVCPVDTPLPGAPLVETFDFVLEERARGFRFVGTTLGITVIGSGMKQYTP